MRPIKELSKVQKEMLWIVSSKGRNNNPPKLDQFYKQNICNLFWKSFDHEGILKEFDKLVEFGYFELVGDPTEENYKYSKEGYFETEKYFRFKFLFKVLIKKGTEFWIFIWKHFIFTIITAAITAYITVYFKS